MNMHSQLSHAYEINYDHGFVIDKEPEKRTPNQLKNTWGVTDNPLLKMITVPHNQVIDMLRIKQIKFTRCLSNKNMLLYDGKYLRRNQFGPVSKLSFITSGHSNHSKVSIIKYHLRKNQCKQDPFTHSIAQTNRWLIITKTNFPSTYLTRITFKVLTKKST